MEHFEESQSDPLEHEFELGMPLTSEDHKKLMKDNFGLPLDSSMEKYEIRKGVRGYVNYDYWYFKNKETGEILRIFRREY